MKALHSLSVLALICGALAFASTGCSTHEHATAMQSTSAGTYPLTKCVVSGEDLGDTPYVFTQDGKTVKLCCKDCLAKFNQDPAKYMAKITEAK